jgi:hypothetical protein
MVLGTTTLAPATRAANAAGPATVSDYVATAGYWLFVALLLGMIAAAMGGSQARKKQPNELGAAETDPGIRRVA